MCAASGLGGVGSGFSYTRPRQLFSLSFIQLFFASLKVFCSIHPFKLFSPLSNLADQVAFDVPDARLNRQLAQPAAAAP